MKQQLGTWATTMFFKVDSDGKPVGCCFRINCYHGHSYMFGCNDYDIYKMIEQNLKSTRPGMFPTIFNNGEDAFEKAQEIAKQNDFLPFVN